jgi:hypothetical protein
MDDMQGGQGGMDGSGGPGGGMGAPPPPMGDAPNMDGSDIGGPGDDTIMMGGNEGSMPTADMGNDPNAPMESIHSNKPIINEQNDKLDILFNEYLSRMNERKGKHMETEYKRADIYDSDALMINEDFDKMIDELGKFVDKD